MALNVTSLQEPMNFTCDGMGNANSNNTIWNSKVNEILLINFI